MEHVEYVHTVGMDEADLVTHLEDAAHGVLALADGDDAYAVPLSHHYDGERLLLRVSKHASDSEKVHYLETTDTATYVVYEGSDEESWSVHVRGPVRPWEGEADEETMNEWFPPFRLFDEDVAEVELVVYELEMQSVVGRETA